MQQCYFLTFTWTVLNGARWRLSRTEMTLSEPVHGPRYEVPNLAFLFKPGAGFPKRCWRPDGGKMAL